MFVALHGWRDELTGVELRVDGLDEPLLRSLLVGVLGNFEDDDAGDLLGLLAGALGEPADGDLLLQALDSTMPVRSGRCMLTLPQLIHRFRISKGMAGCAPWPDSKAARESKTAEPSCKGLGQHHGTWHSHSLMHAIVERLLACLLAMQRCRQARDNAWVG